METWELVTLFSLIIGCPIMGLLCLGLGSVVDGGLIVLLVLLTVIFSMAGLVSLIIFGAISYNRELSEGFGVWTVVFAVGYFFYLWALSTICDESY